MRTINGIQLKKIDIPKSRQNYSEIFAELKIGEGFEVTESDIASVRASACNHKRTHNRFDYTTRKTDTGSYMLVRTERN